MGQLDRFRLDDRVAFIAGGGGAIGSAMAVAFAEAGARVAVVDLAQDTVDATAARVAAVGGECLALAGDMTDRAAADAVVARAPWSASAAWTSSSTPSAAEPARSSSRPRTTPTTPGTGSTTSTCAARSCPRRPP